MARRPQSTRFPTKQEILRFLTEQGEKATRRDIARHFNIKGEQRAELRALMKEMEEEGALTKGDGKRFRAAGELPPVLPVDVMSVDDEGDLVCMPSVWREPVPPPMIRMSQREATKTKPSPGIGDRLLVRLKKVGDDGYEATVIKPIGKASHRFLAVFRKTRYGGLGEPVERRARTKFTIDKTEARGAKDGDLVWLETAKRRGSTSTHARVVEVAGHIDDRDSFSLIALANHSIPIDLPQEVIDEAEKAKTPPLDNRTDLREMPLLTIDPADARDHDDAVWAAPDTDPKNDGGFVVVVAIADVSWFVRPESKLDREAQKRGNSVYLPDRVIPMLPERLSNDLCSLREGVERPCLAVEMVLDASGRKKSHKFMRAMMRSAAKLAYEDAQKLIEKPDDSTVVGETVTALKKAFDARWAERSTREPLDLDLPERKIVLNKHGEIDRVEMRERFDAHRLIEEFMILANIAAAETLERRKTNQIYRVHDTPDDEKLQSVREYLATLDYSLVKGGSIRPRHFNQLLKIAEEREQKQMVSEVVLRSQAQAVYATENLGHFGLNLARYSHFTSPIRRYADLTIHRALVRACKLGEGGQTQDEAENLDDIAEKISDYERRAMAAERESKDRYLAAYHEDHLGEEFTGRIRGVTRFGLFVSLDQTGADGFIPMRSLGFERFRFEEENHRVVGETSGGIYRLGQTVSVRLAEATPLTGGMRFEMLSDPLRGSAQKGPSPSKGKPVRGRFARTQKPKGNKATAKKATTGKSAGKKATSKKAKGATGNQKPRSKKKRRSNAKPRSV
ncbi:MAG: ribonuclease R [Pseudomonadota bacterium]